MKRNTSFAGVAVLLVGIGLLAPRVAGVALQIEGHVYDSGGNPLNGVTVTVWQGGKPTGAEDKTKDGGHYSVAIMSGQPVTRVEYTLARYDPGVETHLSDKQPHKISKILYTPGQPRSLAATLDTMSAYRTSVIFASDPDNGQAERLRIAAFNFRAQLTDLPLNSSVTSSQAVLNYLIADKEQLLAMYRALPQ